MNKFLNNQSHVISILTKDVTQITNNEEIAEILSEVFVSNLSTIDSKPREAAPLLIYPTNTVNYEYLPKMAIEKVRHAL